MKSNILTICFLIFSFFHSFAQFPAQPEILLQLKQSNSTGKVEIIQDKGIEDFLSKIIDDNSRKATMPGFRIVVFRENSNKAIDNAQKARSKVISNFPNVQAELVIEAPVVWVYVGDFRTMTDALRMKSQLKPLFSTDPRIVSTEINVNKLNR